MIAPAGAKRSASWLPLHRRALEPVAPRAYDHDVSIGAPSSDLEFPNLRPEVVAGYRNAPDNTVAEVLDGELSVMPRPRPRHGRGTTVLTGMLFNPFDRGNGGPGGWTFLIEPELHLGPKPDIVVPDLAGWRTGRLPVDVIDDDAPAAINYRREGVGHYWLLDPREKRLEIYRLESGRWVELAELEGEGVVRAEPFEAVELDLSLL